MILLLGALGAFACCTVGGLVGFASSLLYLPVLLMLGVPLSEAVALNLVMAVLTRLPSVVALRDHLDLRRTTTMLAGSVPGIAAGLVVARLVPATVLEVVAGLVVLGSGLHLLRSRVGPADRPPTGQGREQPCWPAAAAVSSGSRRASTASRRRFCWRAARRR